MLTLMESRTWWKGDYMKLRLAIAAVVSVALAGCGAQTKPAAEASGDASSSAASAVATSSAATSAASAPAAVPANGAKPPKEFLIGKWGTNGDCTLAMDLRPDGTSDGPFGNWTYTDGVIGFADAPDLRVNVTVIDDNSMQSTNGDGSTSIMTRCP